MIGALFRIAGMAIRGLAEALGLVGRSWEALRPALRELAAEIRTVGREARTSERGIPSPSSRNSGSSNGYVEIKVTGLKELQEFLDDFPPKLEANVMRGAVRAGMKVVKPVAQSNVRKVSGLLAAGLKISTRRKSGTVIASLKATGKHAFIAHMIEFTGAKPHTISAKHAKALFTGKGHPISKVSHPGFKRTPFMRPALDSQAQNAVIAAAEYIKNRLATKNGIDTSDVVIEGDE